MGGAVARISTALHRHRRGIDKQGPEFLPRRVPLQRLPADRPACGTLNRDPNTGSPVSEKTFQRIGYSNLYDASTSGTGTRV